MTLKYHSDTCSVEVIQASVCKLTKKKILTLVLEYPRAIHAQLMTHRVFSRSSSSSRAIPIKTAIQQIKDNPAKFIWTENQKGMQGAVITDQSIIDEVERAVDTLREFTFSMVEHISNPETWNIHKQNAGRFLEPFQNIKVLLTATEWENWDWLRNDEEAQGEIADLAVLIKEAKDKANYVPLRPGQYHVPFINRRVDDDGSMRYYSPEGFELTLTEAIKMSMAINAQTSYRKADTSPEKVATIQERLFTGRKIHASPSEHIATPIGVIHPRKPKSLEEALSTLPKGVTSLDRYGVAWSANFSQWIQYRQFIPNHDAALTNKSA